MPYFSEFNVVHVNSSVVVHVNSSVSFNVAQVSSMVTLFVAVYVVHYFGLNVILLCDAERGFSVFDRGPSTWGLESEAGRINNWNDGHCQLAIGEVRAADASFVFNFGGEIVIVTEG
jgi:hypothetical protein